SRGDPLVPLSKGTGTKGYGIYSRPFSPGSRTGANGPLEPGQMGHFLLVFPKPKYDYFYINVIWTFCDSLRQDWPSISLPYIISNLTPIKDPEETYLMLAYWLPNTPHTLPINATHRVGIGAFIMNDKREVLVVQEKNDVLKGLGIWKFPTRVVEPGDDINIGVVREVKEETGVDAKFVEVVSFRQSHKAYFEKLDLFFVCILRPLSVDITKQESEIEDWMPVEEFAAQPFVQKYELVKYILEVGLAKVDKEYAGFSPISIKSAFSEKQSLFNMNRRDLEKASGSISTQKDS
ncbi:hypothetical protein ZWY2020_020982, partial [Hordeum vulgare]